MRSSIQGGGELGSLRGNGLSTVRRVPVGIQDHLANYISEGGEKLANEPTEMDKLIVGAFEKAEELIENSKDSGKASAEFLDTLMGCMAYFHNRHYPEFSHAMLLHGFADGVLEKAKLLRDHSDDPVHFHFTIVGMGKKK